MLSRRGELQGYAQLTEAVRLGAVFVPFVKLEESRGHFLTNSAARPLRPDPLSALGLRVVRLERGLTPPLHPVLFDLGGVVCRFGRSAARASPGTPDWRRPTSSTDLGGRAEARGERELTLERRGRRRRRGLVSDGAALEVTGRRALREALIDDAQANVAAARAAGLGACTTAIPATLRRRIAALGVPLGRHRREELVQHAGEGPGSVQRPGGDRPPASRPGARGAPA